MARGGSSTRLFQAENEGGQKSELVVPSGTRAVIDPEQGERLKRFLSFQVSSFGKNLDWTSKRFVNLCRCIIARPSIILLEEEGLLFGRGISANLISLFKSIKSKCTVLSLTKDNANILLYDNLFLIDSGTVVEENTPWMSLNTPESIIYNFVRETDAKNFKWISQRVKDFKQTLMNRTLKTRNITRNDISKTPIKESLKKSSHNLHQISGIRKTLGNAGFTDIYNLIDTDLISSPSSSENEENLREQEADEHFSRTGAKDQALKPPASKEKASIFKKGKKK
jgi:ABC-type methionine transport system ATPase subunit